MRFYDSGEVRSAMNCLYLQWLKMLFIFANTI